MKKLTTLLLAIMVAASCFAQYDETFTKVNAMLYPDNSFAKQIKKQGYTSLHVIGYEPDARDTSETIFSDLFQKYDAKGRLVYISADKEGSNQPTTTYSYDEKDRVNKYTYNSGKKPAETYEFEYDKKKGLINIKHTGEGAYTWVDSTGLLIAITELDTQHFYFDKKEIRITRYMRKYREAGFAKGFFYTVNTAYTYDKKGNITNYKKVETDKFSDTMSVETGEYTYVKKKLTRAVQLFYNYSEFRREQAQIAEDHSYSYDKKSGFLFNHSHNHKKYYSMGGELMNDASFIDEMYTLTKDGLKIRASRSYDPGVVRALIYNYGK